MTELSNLCGLAQVQAVKKSCHAALVFSHGSGAPVILSEGKGQTLREVAVICERSTLDS